MNGGSEPERALRRLIDSLSPGDRLPTVRALMREHGASQGVVQAALRALERDGLIESYVGRGTFVSGGGAPLFANAAKRKRSVLLLTRNVGSARTRRVLSRLQDALSEHDVDTIQITYSETEHGLYMLRSMPSVDVAIVQCHFEPVAIELLSLLRRKAKSVLFDGATVSGLDVDAVASNWRVSLDMCMRHLMERGHRNIGMIGSTGRSRPIEAIRLHYESLRAWSPGGAVLHDPVWLDSLPNEDNLGEIGEALDVARRPDGSFPWSALVIWGALDGKLLQGVFSERDIAVPGDLSVVLLGHPGVATESNNFFTVIGSSAAETISALCELTLRRMADERAEFVTRYLEPVIAEGQSEVDTI